MVLRRVSQRLPKAGAGGELVPTYQLDARGCDRVQRVCKAQLYSNGANQGRTRPQTLRSHRRRKLWHS
jgi:hypothetical protein